MLHHAIFRATTNLQDKFHETLPSVTQPYIMGATILSLVHTHTIFSNYPAMSFHSTGKSDG